MSLRSLRLTGGLRGEWCQPNANSTTSDPCCHGYKIWDENGYNSACMRLIPASLSRYIHTYIFVYYTEWQNASAQDQNTSKKNTNKLESKNSNKTVNKRSLRLTEVSGQAVEIYQSNFTTTDHDCHGNEIWNKTGYISAYINSAEILAPGSIRG